MDYDWDQIKLEYVTGGKSYSDLARKHGCSRTKIARHGTKEDWVGAREQYRHDTYTEKVEASVETEVNRYRQIVDTADALLIKIRSAVDTLTDDMILTSPQTIRAITASLKDIKELHGYKDEETETGGGVILMPEVDADGQ